MIEQTKFKVGQVWKDKLGALHKIIDVSDCSLLVKGFSPIYGITDRKTFHYSLDGSFFSSYPCKYDLVEFVYNSTN